MIVKDPTRGNLLECFEQFRVDFNLPKHSKSNSEDPSMDSNEADSRPSQGAMKRARLSNRGMDFGTPDSPRTFSRYISLRQRLVALIARCLGVYHPSMSWNPVSIKYGQRSPVEMFTFIRGNLTEAGQYVTRMKAFQQKLTSAQALGQTALVETLTKGLDVVKGESTLFAAGLAKFVTEKQVVEFATKCQKGLRLDWVANFTGVIPEPVLIKKQQADQLGVFDNYLVMHYDPTGQAHALTQQEIRARRDPILFGVINGARKLYFVADWVTPEDDLTLAEVAKVLGRPIDEIKQDPTLE